mgnify:CR=1 FL=1
MGKIKIKFQEQIERAPVNLDKHDDDTYRVREANSSSIPLINHLIVSLVPSDVISKVFREDEPQ